MSRISDYPVDFTPFGPSALEKFYDYYIKESDGDPIPFGKREKITVGLGLFGSSAGIYYWPSAAAYGANKPAWLKYSLILGNTVVGVLFLVKATDDLFEAILKESKAPPELKDYVKLPSRRELISKYVKMIIGSAICSVPFGVATYLFPLPNCDQTACLATIVAHSTLANIILHAVSWNVILTPQYWVYRLPLLPFEKVYKRCKNSRLTLAKKQVLELEEKREGIYQKYRAHLSQYFNAQSLRIVNAHRKNSSISATNFLRNRTDPDSSLMTMAEIEDKVPAPAAQHSSRLWYLCAAAHRAMKSGVGFIGATFMTIGCIGWVANPIYLGLTEGMNLYESILTGILPAYSMGVLLAFYGEAIFKQMYDYLTSWEGDKLPLEAKIYPISFTLFLLVNAYLSIFSYGTAQILIETIFGDDMWDAYRPYLQAIAYPAVPVLSFVPFLDLFIVFVRKMTAKFGHEGSDEKLCSRLLINAAAMGQEILFMEGSRLMESIQRYSPGQQKLLGINSEEFAADQQTLAGLEDQISVRRDPSMSLLEPPSDQSNSQCCGCPFPFWNSSRQVKEPLLINELKNTEDFFL